jgi:hypothetical protein
MFGAGLQTCCDTPLSFGVIAAAWFDVHLQALIALICQPLHTSNKGLSQLKQGKWRGTVGQTAKVN